MIAIIDYDAGNIKSVEKALHFIGEEAILTRDREEILTADRIILPGVGCFSDAMDNLHKYDLPSVIKEAVDMGIPFLGICLGLQLLFEESAESPEVKGLELLSGQILKIPAEANLKIPHMGWNSLHLQNEGRLFAGLNDEEYVYFVHSYYLQASDTQIVKATTEYGVTIHASVESGNVFGCQFHPEKSSDVGLKILKNFANISRRGD
jgi:imidazole glycerol phosphate synthase, glutamine amidotransferase subunit